MVRYAENSAEADLLARVARLEAALKECQRLAIDRVRTADAAVKKDIYAADALFGIAKVSRSALELKAESFIPGKHCNYCGRSRQEARKDGPCPGPHRSRLYPGQHSWMKGGD